MLSVTSCTKQNKVVEYPLVDVTTTHTLDFSKVELTDTATVIHVNATYIPHNWIKIASGTVLKHDGKQYALTGSEGIQPDSLLYMPDSGKASFTLFFEPLPRSAKSFDFIEGMEEGCFNLFGVDLTGRRHYEAPEGIPAEARRMDGNTPLPAPQFNIGQTTVRLHLLYYKEGMGNEQSIYVNGIDGGQETYREKVDPATGTVTFRFMQYGPAQILSRNFGAFLTAPGEEIDLYADMRVSGYNAARMRENGKGIPEKQEFQSLYATGTYADLNNLCNSGKRYPYYSMNLFNGRFADYKLGSKAYAEHVVNTYKTLADSIDNEPALPPLLKSFMKVSLQQEAVTAMFCADEMRERNYRHVNNMYDFSVPVEGIEPAKPEDQKMLAGLFDMNNPMLLMGENAPDYIRSVVYASPESLEALGIKDGLIPALRTFVSLVGKAKDAALTEDDRKAMSATGNAFCLAALDSLQADAKAKLSAIKENVAITPAPDVPLEKLFGAIIAPYKGKVILVDFWNTWCGPCRRAISANEPLKSTELKSDDIVWIYLANETSPIVKYKTMIADIKGIHYRLNESQWRYLTSGLFKIDGIPSYVLVDKDGNYALRNDFRDHGLMVNTLKDMVK